jgi:hypothetical protein
MTTDLEVPVTIISFDRPHYLERVCRSLQSQHDFRIRDDRVILAQDGAVNAMSGRRAASDENIEQCVRVFRDFFPRGTVLDYSRNLGVALNIHRAEHHVFDILDSEYGYFFEDDLELGYLYTSILERMRAAFTPDMRIGYWAAYGNHLNYSKGPDVVLQPMAHNWGFGLFRSAWRDIAIELSAYFSIISKIDYQYRPALALFNLMRNSEFAVGSTSQDAFREMAAAKLGYARVMTDVCFARYIGEEGIHFTPENFRRHGYDRMQAVSEGTFSMARVTPQAVECVRQQAASKMRQFRQHQLDQILEARQALFDDGDRMVSLEEILILFRLLTDIRSTPPTNLTDAAGKISIREMRGRIIDEFDVVFKNPSPRRQQKQNFVSDKNILRPLSMTPVTRADVISAYQLILGRNPENEEVIGYHLSRKNISELRAAFVKSKEFQKFLKNLFNKN